MASAPATAPAANPKIVRRELVRTRETSAGRTRGVTAPRSTPNDLDMITQPNAAGYSTQPSGFRAITTTSRARAAKDAPSAYRLPCWIRSSAGPTTGATTANGATVISR
ncbi:hypothetical protein [Actinoalloteichus caeruleus]|uniref:Uncharacterized protein n=1 Tax=Actinoalloteichus caeruleus DSM 43889 TaxID=1120930 RepID=A0ABT1JJ62_ACTCY|nr:hypothetical protein [Actinoalloteichus caeruleus]MCP2332543.1 hypothetical protein [Actinoalloteichus caeruleus DSM 43889]